MTTDELESRIKTLEKDTKILKRLYFVKYRYKGESIEESSQRIGITRNEGYIWQRRWNERGYDGLIPRYGGGRPMKLSSDELDRLIEILNQKTTWTTDDVRTMIHQEFGVEYTLNPYYPKEVLLFKYLPVFHSNPFWFSQSVP